ncbi:hypothetical protein CWC39_05870 [Corynebacterium heidelbergense]|uniref:Uncharacterized protein n=1 Tax=Corynebacterium heidelbergense TaxID=2055947 RepID=A0A364VBI6_9CORY|nr:hypothetical protein CWC39_05870 [Corynebacterium heidelbergense]
MIFSRPTNPEAQPRYGFSDAHPNPVGASITDLESGRQICAELDRAIVTVFLAGASVCNAVGERAEGERG